MLLIATMRIKYVYAFCIYEVRYGWFISDVFVSVNYYRSCIEHLHYYFHSYIMLMIILHILFRAVKLAAK